LCVFGCVCGCGVVCCLFVCVFVGVVGGGFVGGGGGGGGGGASSSSSSPIINQISIINQLAYFWSIWSMQTLALCLYTPRAFLFFPCSMSGTVIGKVQKIIYY